MLRDGFTPDDVLAQLRRIITSPEFHATEKMRSFLRFVVDETVAGRAHRLKGYTIATQVFDRGPEFDAAQDPIVRIQAGRLRRAMERYYLVAGTHDPIVIDVPKGGYVPRFLRRTEQAHPPVGEARGETAPHTAAPRAAVGPSIAVLPLENLTDDQDQRYFTVGLAEELTTELGRFQDVAVVSCQLPPTDAALPADPVDVGRSVGARFVLRGTARRDADTIKVAMHLVDAARGRELWSEAYTHPVVAHRLITTQEQIARSVVAAVASEYGIIARRLSAEARKKPPEELATYEAMLRYYSHQVAPAPESAAACFPALQQAVEREPDYGPAWSALATLYCQLFTMDVPGFGDSLDTALDHARRGVSLEPGSQLGRLILAYASYLADDSEAFEQEIETAIALNPNSPYTVGTAGYFHAMRGDFERGLPLVGRAIATNPCHPNWFHAAYVVDHLCHQRYEAALQEVERHKPFFSFWLQVAYAAILGRLGRVDEARNHVNELERGKPDFEARANELFRRSLKIDALIEDLLDGLRQAGMQV